MAPVSRFTSHCHRDTVWHLFEPESQVGVWSNCIGYEMLRELLWPDQASTRHVRPIGHVWGGGGGSCITGICADSCRLWPDQASPRPCCIHTLTLSSCRVKFDASWFHLASGLAVGFHRLGFTMKAITLRVGGYILLLLMLILGQGGSLIIPSWGSGSRVRCSRARAKRLGKSQEL